MSLTRKPLASHHRIVIKIGSALLVDRKTGLKKDWLDAICEDIAALKKNGADVQVVSSGAIALGRTVLGLPSGALKLEDLREFALSNGEPKQISGKQEWLENVINQYI